MTTQTLITLTRRVERLAAAATGRRVIIGVVGPPGAGKSTLAERLTTVLGDQAVLLPMDGFHLAQKQLELQGKASRKGAPDTFDAHGYLNLLTRLHGPDPEIYAPSFDRSIEEPIAAAIAVRRQHRIVISEGNYLLLDSHGWGGVATMLDECWYLDPGAPIRLPRLIRRHVEFGRSEQEARTWVEAVDEVNTRQIADTRSRATLLIDQWA